MPPPLYRGGGRPRLIFEERKVAPKGRDRRRGGCLTRFYSPRQPRVAARSRCHGPSRRESHPRIPFRQDLRSHEVLKLAESRRAEKCDRVSLPAAYRLG